MKKTKLFLNTSLAGLMLFSCSSNSVINGEWYRYNTTSYQVHAANSATVPLFNTVMGLNYYVSEKENNDSFKEGISSYYLSLLRKYHVQFDRHYYYYANENKNSYYVSLKTINDSYGSGKEITCSKELYSLLKEGIKCTTLTEGYFSFFSGQLVDYWDSILESVNEGTPYQSIDPLFNDDTKNKIAKLTASLPTLEEVNSLLTFNDQNKTVIFNTLPNIEVNGETLERNQKNSPYRPLITSGAIAKGYATDLVKNELLANGYKHGWLNSGTSSISLLSSPTYLNKKCISLSFADSRSSGLVREAAFSLNIYKEANLSTSGSTLNDLSYSFDLNGKDYYRHHIVNPYNGDTEQYHELLTLYSEKFSAGQLDAFSTAFFSLDDDGVMELRKKILKEYPKYDLDIVMLDIDEDNETLLLKTTSNFSNSLKLVCEKAKVINLES